AATPAAAWWRRWCALTPPPATGSLGTPATRASIRPRAAPCDLDEDADGRAKLLDASAHRAEGARQLAGGAPLDPPGGPGGPTVLWTDADRAPVLGRLPVASACALRPAAGAAGGRPGPRLRGRQRG